MLIVGFISELPRISSPNHMMWHGLRASTGSVFLHSNEIKRMRSYTLVIIFPPRDLILICPSFLNVSSPTEESEPQIPAPIHWLVILPA